MARQFIDIGTNSNDGTGDTLRVAFDKVNDNFIEVYTDVQSVATAVNSIDYDDISNTPNLSEYLKLNNANTDVTISARSINLNATDDVQTLSADAIRLYANTSITIETEGEGPSYFWIFRPDGSLIFPDGTTQETAFQATQTQIGQWDDAYSWGDHANAGYLTANTLSLTYEPSDPSMWQDPPPETVGEALDRIAALIFDTVGNGA